MNDGFWHSIGRYGLFHKASAEQFAKRPRSLLVFVHGLFGDCRSSWGKMPEWVLENAGIDMDVASFSYPSQVWQRTSIAQAADDLCTWLNAEFGHYRHILFVAHSTGGLVVKYLLAQSFMELEQQMRRGEFDFSTASSLWLRTRHIINIAVPHSGGSPFSTAVAKTAYRSIYPFMAPALKMMRFITQGKRDWGRNDIVTALRWQNPWLHMLEEQFVRQQQRTDDLGLPHPIVHDVYAKSDLSVPIAADAEQRNIYFRGTHKSIKIPNQSSEPIVAIVADFAVRYGSDMALTIADWTLARIAQINKITAVESLIDDTLCGIGADRDSPLPSSVAASFGTQAQVLERVLKDIQSGGERPRRIVVTGMGGVGKSLVLRMIAWRLCRRFQDNPMSERPLPLFIPLQQVTLDKAREAAFTWQAMWRWWLQWARTLHPDMGCDEAWLEQRFRNRAATVILDGLDDFLLNHPLIGLSSIVTMLNDALQRYAENARLTVIIAIRSNFHGLDRLTDAPNHIYEILRLSIAQSKQLYPSCGELIDQIQDRELLDFILTPLILSKYEPDPRLKSSGQGLTRARIMQQTLRAILERGQLVGFTGKYEKNVEIDQLALALTLIAWLFFYRSRGEIHTDVLREEAAALRERWENFFRAIRASDRDFYLNELEKNVNDSAAAFRLIEKPETCHALLQRTVFVPSGPNRVRFAHRNWQEFLLAQYLALCIKSRHFEELGITAFHSRIYRMTGDFFHHKVIDEACIRALLETWKKTKNTYSTGNVIAFLTWTRTPIDARAIQLLLGELAHFESLSRLVLIGGLGYRVLADHADDYSLADLRRALFPRLCEFANPATAPVDDAVACSMSWCYQKAFAKRFGLPKPATSWPAIGFDDRETLKALPMICSVRNGEWVLDARSRSLQLAFLAPIQEAYREPKLAIRALHYLYYLVVAKKHGVHVVELCQELPSLLAAGCKFEKIIESFTLVPEVLALYRNCQALYCQMEAAAV